MGDDIKRTKHRSFAQVGQGSALEAVSPDSSAQLFSEVQENIEVLSRDAAAQADKLAKFVTDFDGDLTETNGKFQELLEDILANAQGLEDLSSTVDRILEQLLRDKDTGVFQRAVVNAVGNDTLDCNFLIENEIGDGVIVAKPYELRPSSYHGKIKTYGDGTVISYVYTTQRERVGTRTVPSEGTVTEIVTPDYILGDPIRIAKGPTGINGVEWEDASLTARGWAQETP